MWLTQLHLEQFRCYRSLDIEIPREGIRLAGSNASGKTSFLEAIQLLTTLRSARATVERELINWESNQDLDLPPYARLVAEFEDSTDAHRIEVSLAADPNRAAYTRKSVRLDGHPRRSIDAMGRFKTVLFEPEDMDLVLGSPSNRRRFLDITLSSLDSVYIRTLSQYGKIVEQRNSLLKQLRESSSDSRQNRLGELAYWNEELVKRAAYLTVARVRLLGRLAGPLQESFQALLDDVHQLTLCYMTADFAPNDFAERLIDMDPEDAQRRVIHWLEGTLEERQDEELRRGVTVLGPHRDDLSFLLDGRELSSFGSRGQQRVAVVSLKLAEVETVCADSGQRPVLLLDDVLSELDAERRERMLSRVGAAGGQVIVTATDERFLDSPEINSLPLYQVSDGSIAPSVGHRA